MSGNMNVHIYIYLKISDMARVVEFLAFGRQRPVYPTQSIPGLLMVCRQNELGHQQLWFSPDSSLEYSFASIRRVNCAKRRKCIACVLALQWRHNGCDSVSNHQPRDCLLKRLFRRRSKKTSKLRVTGLCAGNSPGTGEFPTQMASNAEKCFLFMTSSWRNFFAHIQRFVINISCSVPMNTYWGKHIGLYVNAFFRTNRIKSLAMTVSY